MKLTDKTLSWGLIVIALLVGLTSLSYADSRIVIQLTDKVFIKGNYIKLGEIATVKTNEATTKRDLGELLLGKAPLPGKNRVLDRDYILLRLKQSEIELSQVEINGPEKILIERDFLEITPDELRKVVIDFLREQPPWKNPEMEIDVAGIKDSIIAPSGHLEYQFVLPKQSDFLGTIPIMVIMKIDKQEFKKLWVNALVKANQKVVVAKRALRTNEIIEEKDLILMDKEMEQINGETYKNMADVVGKKAKGLILPEQVMTSSLLENPPVVKRGDMLTIIAENRAMSVKITAMGKAEQNGRKGEFIKVTNSISKKEIQARVLDSKTVLVEF